MKRQPLPSYIHLIPLAGIAIFFLLYVIAAIVYPGGNYTDHNSKGFSVLHNYWCDLLNTEAQNGQVNTSRLYAITAQVIVCTSLIFFWYFLPAALTTNSMVTTTIRLAGITSMIMALFIVTNYHDEAITCSGFFGGIAFIATFIAIYKLKWYRIFWLGMICLLMGAVTFIIYKSRHGLLILPMIQKVTLLLCLCWIVTTVIKTKSTTR